MCKSSAQNTHMVPPVKEQPGQRQLCGATENAAALKERQKAKVFYLLDQCLKDTSVGLQLPWD